MVNLPFGVTVAAQDVANNMVPLFTNTVVLSGRTGSMATNTAIGNGTGTWSYPLYTFYHDARTQVIYLTNEIGASCMITSLALNVTTVPGQTMNNWTIRLKHTPLSNYGGSPVWETGWTTVYQTNLAVGVTGWQTFVFSTPFVYNGASNLMVDFSFNNSSYTTSGYCQFTAMPQNRSIYFYTDSGYGDPLGWPTNSYNPTPHLSVNIPNVRVGVTGGRVVAITPANSGNFVGGVWTGVVAVLEATGNMCLYADDGSGHAGTSAVFTVQTCADMGIAMADSPDPVTAGSNLTYSICVSNSGPDNATSVQVLDLLPAMVGFVSASASQGTCANVGRTITWNVGMVSNGCGASATIVVVPTIAGTLTNTATLTANVSDSNANNNVASAVTTVTGSGVLAVTPASDLRACGLVGGPFSPTSQMYALTNSGTDTLTWQATNLTSWVNLSATSGNLPVGAATTVVVSINANSLPAGTYSDTVAFSNLSTAVGSTTRAVNLTVAVLDHFGFGTIASPQGAGIPFSAALSAQDINGATITVFQGTVVLSGTGDHGPVIMTPTSVALTNGVWNGSVQVNTPDTNVRVIANDGVGHMVQSNPFNVTVGPLDHFAWGLVATQQYVGVAFPVAITAQDAGNNAVTSFTGAVTLSGVTETSTNRIMLTDLGYDTTSSANYTRGIRFQPTRNITMTHVRHFWGTKVSIWTDSGVLVASKNVVSTNGTWLETPLDSPVMLTSGTVYRIAGFAAGGIYYYRSNGGMPINFPDGVILNGAYSNSGDTFPGSTSATRYLVDLRYTVGVDGPVNITPTNSGNFVGGVWSGSVTVAQQATNIYLQANDGAGHIGTSGVFCVYPPATFTLTMVQTGNGSTSLGVSPFTAVPIAANATTQIVYTAADWFLINSLTSNSVPASAASGLPIFTQTLANIAADISNNVVFALASPAQTGYTNVPTEWLTNWQAGAVQAAVGLDSFSLHDKYVLGLDPTSSNSYLLTIEGCAPAGSNIVVRLRRDVTGTLATDGMNGHLILQAADSLTSGFTNLPVVILTGNDAFDGTGHRNYTNAVDNVRKFYKAIVE